MYDGCKNVIGNSSNNFFEGCRRAQMGWFGTSGVYRNGTCYSCKNVYFMVYCWGQK